MYIDTSIYNKIFFVDALCGAGKTHQACIFAVRQASELNKKILIVQPTKELLDETYQKIKALTLQYGIEVTIIHSETEKTRKTVRGEILSDLRTSSQNDVGEILLITQSSFFDLPAFFHPEKWTVIIDEIPQITSTYSENLSDTHSFITQYLTVIEKDEANYLLTYKRHKKSKRELKRIQQNKNKDRINEILQELALKVLSPNFDVIISKETWNRIKNDKKQRFKITTHAQLKPSKCLVNKFEEVIVMGANFKESLFHNLLLDEHNNISFVPHKISKELGFAKHMTKEPITLYYITDENRWSKSAYEKTVEYNGGTKPFIEFVIPKVEEVLKDDFLYSTNNITANSNIGCGEVFAHIGGSIRLNGTPYGMNKYEDCHNVAFLSALNPIPATYGFLKDRDINSESVNRALVYEACYQALMRSSVRRKNAKGGNVFVVPTKAIATWLALRFDNVEIKPLDDIPKLPGNSSGRPKSPDVALTSKLRKEKYIRKKIIEEILELRKTLDNQKYGNGNTIGSSITVPAYQEIQTFESVYSEPKENKIWKLNSHKQLIEKLQALSTREIYVKENNELISPCVFGSSIDSKGKRKKTESNIKYAWCVILDIDSSDMPPRAFMKMLPDIHICCCNTFNGNGRYRIFIAIDKPITAKAYRHVVKAIMNIAEENGYDECIDESSIKPTQIYYLPCRAKTDNPEDSFFIEQDGSPLRVVELIENQPLETTSEAKEQVYEFKKKTSYSQQEIKDEMRKAKAEYRKIESGKGLRNTAFYTIVARKAEFLGLSEQEISRHLHDADYDGSRGTKGVEDAIRSLRKYREKNDYQFNSTRKKRKCVLNTDEKRQEMLVS